MTRFSGLTVVLAATEIGESLRDSLRRLLASEDAAETEIVVALAGTDRNESLVALAPDAIIVECAADALVPALWAAGIARATRPWVALTLGDCVVASDWLARARAVTAAHPDLAGFGGPIAPPVGGGGRDWAVYFLRYSGYLDLAPSETKEIPGDNAVYRREDLDRFWRQRSGGFWEVLFHRALRAEGRTLRWEPGLRVHLAATPAVRKMAVARCRHGLHFGTTREIGGVRRLAAGIAAPALVPLLMTRIVRRVLTKRPEWRSRLVASIPWLLLYVVSWSVGEALGYLLPRGRLPS